MCVVERLLGLRCTIVPRNVHKPSKQVLSPSIGDVDNPHRDACTRKADSIATSSKLTIISPTGKWNKCVSGRH
jgi:hypothetical protein